MEKPLDYWIETIQSDLGRKLSKNKNSFLESLTELLGRPEWKEGLTGSEFRLLDQTILSIDRALRMAKSILSMPID